MALRSGHGRGSGSMHVEVLPVDEQPVGIPAPARAMSPALPAGGRDASGRFADRQFASELARRGGLARAAKANQLRALSGLGLHGATPAALAPYLDDANQFAESEVGRLARECGGGVCPPNAAALVQQAALAMAGSRAAYAEGDAATGAKLGVEVRQNLLGARELTVLEAKARPRGKNPVLVAIEAKAGGGSA